MKQLKGELGSLEFSLSDVCNKIERYLGEINRGSDGDEERKDNGFYCRWKSPCIECKGLNGLKGKRSLTGKKKKQCCGRSSERG